MIRNNGNSPRVAPPGFTKAQMKDFLENGFLVVRDAISRESVRQYLEALERAAAHAKGLSERDLRIYGPSLGDKNSDQPSKRSDSFLHIEGLVGLDQGFEEIIDSDRHIGFVYDLFGELTKLHISEAFIRPDSNGCNPWHVDGPRMVPFSAFAKELPLQIRIGYWLTDLPNPSMGNLVVLPGSHRMPYFDGADTTESRGNELVVCLRSGDMTIMHGSLWHRVDRNTSGVARKNLYLGYCPSWVTSADHLFKGSDWYQTLPRERRIILRHYEHPYDYSKPPASDCPLYLERPNDPYPNRFEYPASLSFHRRKHPTLLERFLNHECSAGS